MIFQIYGRAFKALMKQPIRLIGLSLFGILVTSLACFLFSAPVGLGVALGLLFNAAMAQIFLRSYRCEQCNTQDMFAPFKGLDIFKRTLGGMAWRELWILIWSLIPFAGVVFGIIKSYTYALTPYILMNEEDVKPMDAIKVSKERTAGYRGKMFGADILLVAAIVVTTILLGLLCTIKYIQILFIPVAFLFYIAVIALGPLFVGLVHAAFYEEIMNPSLPVKAEPIPQPAPVDPYVQQGWNASYPPLQQNPGETVRPAAVPLTRFCTNCGTRYDANQTSICPNCGMRVE